MEGESIRKLSLGFVGGGLNSAVGRVHFAACQIDGKWKLDSGVFSRNHEINTQTGREWGVPSNRVHSDFETFIHRERGKLDAVVVLTPTPMHGEQIRQLLNAGFNVISEKALATSSSDALLLAQLAQMNNRRLAVTYNYSGYPMVRELKAWIDAGRFGRVLAVHVDMPQESFLRLNSNGSPLMPQPWRQLDSEIPTVSLDLGTHAHHLVNFLISAEPTSLVALQSHHGIITNVTDFVECLAEYPDKIDVSVSYGKTSLGHRNGLNIRLYGDEAAAEWIQVDPETMRVADSRGNRLLVDRSSPNLILADQDRYQRFKAGHPAGFIEAFGNVYYDLAIAWSSQKNSSESNTPFVYGAKHAAKGLEMMELISLSAKEKRWIEVSSHTGTENGE